MMGKISFFLGLQFSQSPRGIFINHLKYSIESLRKYDFESCDPVDTPMVEKSKLGEDKEGKSVDPSHYRAFLMNQLKVDTLTPELLAGPTYEPMKGSRKSLVELEFFLEEVYKAKTDQLDWNNLEGQQYPHNLLKPLPLIPKSRGRRVIPFDHFINNDLQYLRGGASSKEPESTNAPKENASKTSGKSTKGSKSHQKTASESAPEEEPLQTTQDLEEPAHLEFEAVKVQVSKILPKIEKTVNEQLEAEVLTRASNSSKTSYAMAIDLSELELKKILIEKMESNKSIHRSDEQRNLYKALVDAYECDKIILDTYGNTVTLKRCRNDEDKDEEPSAGSD
nr:uncharacterized mitochondrial protein AtMg00810-like [Tanacetum cinerariifolium]